MNTSTTPTSPTQAHGRPSMLRRLRTLAPRRTLDSYAEALQIAELQAATLNRLIREADPTSDGIRTGHIAGLPRIQIEYADLPISGMSHWNGRAWIICLNRRDSLVRQRFTLLHEFKHIIDHGYTEQLYPDRPRRDREQQVERVCDYFAGCALIPRRELKSAWGIGIQRVPDLAEHFAVSEHAVRVRLSQTGLTTAYDTEPSPRCARPVRTSGVQQGRRPQAFKAIRSYRSTRNNTYPTYQRSYA